MRFLDRIDPQKFQTDFFTEGSSNYAFNLVQKHADSELAEKLMLAMDFREIEFRRGSAGGGNQLRQPYLRPYLSDPKLYQQFPNTEHVHFYGYYIGNFPDLSLDDVDFICDVLKALSENIDIPVIILAGGLGTRLRSVVEDVPKPMAPINGRRFWVSTCIS